MEELLVGVQNAVTRVEKQALSIKIVAGMPKFLLELGDLEQRYHKGLKICVDAERTKSGGELLMNETDLYRDYKYKKRLYEVLLSTIKVLDMYTKES